MSRDTYSTGSGTGWIVEGCSGYEMIRRSETRRATPNMEHRINELSLMLPSHSSRTIHILTTKQPPPESLPLLVHTFFDPLNPQTSSHLQMAFPLRTRLCSLATNAFPLTQPHPSPF